MSWPEDADGDVFRRLEAHNFDFSRPHSIDFNVDFHTWPPSPVAIEKLRSLYGQVKLYEPEEVAEDEDEDEGYALFQVHTRVTYELVTSVQRKASAAMEPFGGVCESWGVMQDAI